MNERGQTRTLVGHETLQGLQQPHGDGEASLGDQASQERTVGDLTVRPEWLSERILLLQ